jgi:hypothetical protein
LWVFYFIFTIFYQNLNSSVPIGSKNRFTPNSLHTVFNTNYEVLDYVLGLGYKTTTVNKEFYERIDNQLSLTDSSIAWKDFVGTDYIGFVNITNV